jgi:RNA polymerase sigma factor (TIGR02999 family)
MTATTTHEVTQLLHAWSGGDQSALDQLVPLVEAELRRLAKLYMTRERPGHALQTTALINEAYLRLIDWKNVQWQNRAHFFGVSAGLMRRILVDFARSQNYAKRGGGMRQVELEEAAAIAQERASELVALDEALNELARLDKRQSQVVELKFFGGLTNEEVATVLNVSLGTVKNDWSDAKAWLHQALSREDKDDA